MLHDDRPDVYTNVEDDDDVKTDLSAATLADGFHIKDKSKAKTADSDETRLDQI